MTMKCKLLILITVITVIHTNTQPPQQSQQEKLKSLNDNIEKVLGRFSFVREGLLLSGKNITTATGKKISKQIVTDDEIEHVVQQINNLTQPIDHTLITNAFIENPVIVFLSELFSFKTSTSGLETFRKQMKYELEQLTQLTYDNQSFLTIFIERLYKQRPELFKKDYISSQKLANIITGGNKLKALTVKNIKNLSELQTVWNTVVDKLDTDVWTSDVVQKIIENLPQRTNYTPNGYEYFFLQSVIKNMPTKNLTNEHIVALYQNVDSIIEEISPMYKPIDTKEDAQQAIRYYLEQLAKTTKIIYERKPEILNPKENKYSPLHIFTGTIADKNTIQAISKIAPFENFHNEINTILDVFHEYGGLEQFTKLGGDLDKNIIPIEASDYVKRYYENNSELPLYNVYHSVNYLQKSI